MSLKYPFREVFRRKILRPKRLWAVLEDIDSKIEAVEGEGGSSSSSDLIKIKIPKDDRSTNEQLKEALVNALSSKKCINIGYTSNSGLKVYTQIVAIDFDKNVLYAQRVPNVDVSKYNTTIPEICPVTVSSDEEFDLELVCQ